MTTCIDKFDDVIDSRDVIARIAELEEEREALADALAEWDASDEAEELRILKALAAEAEGSPDWEHGEALIRESYFQDYAQELAEECGMIPNNLTWPCTCIDWEQAARELKMDYFEVEFDDVTYLIRS
jgi:antirestriction protein